MALFQISNYMLAYKKNKSGEVIIYFNLVSLFVQGMTTAYYYNTLFAPPWMINQVEK